MARHGKAYELPEAYKKLVINKVLVGKARENYELRESEKYSYEDILRKVKEYARSRKLDKDASSGKPGIARGNEETQQEEQWGE